MTFPRSVAEGAGPKGQSPPAEERNSLAGVLSELLAAPICVRCGNSLYVQGRGVQKHTNWDPRGALCNDCWYEDAILWMELREEEWARKEAMEECRG